MPGGKRLPTRLASLLPRGASALPLAIAALALVVGGGVALAPLFLPALPPAPPAGAAVATPGGIAPGVLLGGEDWGGLGLEEARERLALLAEGIGRPPVDASIDRETRGRIPALNGFELDIERTLASLLAADPDEAIDPLLVIRPAAVQLADLPLAPIYRGNPERPAAALLVNVAWGNEVLPGLLDTLDRGRVRASFFLMGEWAARFPEEAREIARRGHEIASHGHTARDYDRLGGPELAREIERAQAAIAAATGVRPRLFSPHKGLVTPAVLRAAQAAGLETVLWSADTVDWMRPGAAAIRERVLARAQPGALVLMHPIDQTVAALPGMIAGLRRQGLALVTLGELLSPDPLPFELPYAR